MIMSRCTPGLQFITFTMYPYRSHFYAYSYYVEYAFIIPVLVFIGTMIFIITGIIWFIVIFNMYMTVDILDYVIFLFLTWNVFRFL